MVSIKTCRVIVAIALVSTTVLACRVRRQVASSKWVDNGTFVLDSGTFIPGVLPLVNEQGGNFCTATAVSDNTLITAAHCVQDKVVDQNANNPSAAATLPQELIAIRPVCAQLIDDVKVCSESAFIPAAYLPQARAQVSNQQLAPQGGQADGPRPEIMGFDVAVLVYPRRSFKFFHPISSVEKPVVGSEVFMVGFSPERLYQDEWPKRWGRNRVDTAASNRAPSEIVSRMTSGEVVALSPGDSGGPLFDTQCRLIAVASRMDERGAVKASIHVGFHSQEIARFFAAVKNASAANYCQSAGDCAAGSSVVEPIHVNNPLHFPCKAVDEDKDPKVVAAMARLQARRNSNQENLASRPISCLDGGQIRGRGGQGGFCVEHVFVEANNNASECDAAFVTQAGQQFMSREEFIRLQRDERVSQPRFSSIDLADDSLGVQLERSGLQIYQGLACRPEGLQGAGKDSCCLQAVCRQIKPASNGQAPFLGDTVACGANVKVGETAAQWLRDNLLMMNTRLAPRAEDLAEQPFPCWYSVGMAMRKARGICYEDPGSGISGGDIAASSPRPGIMEVARKCFAVQAGRKTGREVQCPKSVLLPAGGSGS